MPYMYIVYFDSLQVNTHDMEVQGTVWSIGRVSFSEYYVDIIVDSILHLLYPTKRP